VKVWDLARAAAVKDLAIDAEQATVVAIGPDGSRVAAGGEDGVVRVIEVKTGETTRRLSGHTEGVTAIAFVDAGTVATGDGAGVVRIWNAGDKPAKTVKLAGEEDFVTGLAVSADGKVLAAATSTAVRLFTTDGFKAGKKITAFDTAVTCLALDPTGRTLATGLADSTIALWDLTRLR
jgi:WD40 repeat protein